MAKAKIIVITGLAEQLLDEEYNLDVYGMRIKELEKIKNLIDAVLDERRLGMKVVKPND